MNRHVIILFSLIWISTVALGGADNYRNRNRGIIGSICSKLPLLPEEVVHPSLEFITNQRDNCYLMCFMFENEMVDEYGNYNYRNVVTMFPNDEEHMKIRRVYRRCSRLQDKDPCERINQVAKCILSNQMVRAKFEKEISTNLAMSRLPPLPTTAADNLKIN